VRLREPFRCDWFFLLRAEECQHLSTIPGVSAGVFHRRRIALPDPSKAREGAPIRLNTDHVMHELEGLRDAIAQLVLGDCLDGSNRVFGRGIERKKALGDVGPAARTS
jgi:hypothetical protein